jgi:ribosomal protein S18 acetylase RimI-like enzyme
VPVLDGPPRFSIVVEPKGDARLKNFSCGEAEKWEGFANRVVAKHYLGTAGMPLTLVAMEDPSGELLGLCGFRPMEVGFDPPGRRMAEPPYIHVIGLSRRYRGWTLAEGPTLGSAMLVGTMKKIALLWPGEAMPAIWALVSPENTSAHQLFQRHGFGLIGKPEGDDRRYRPYGLPIF